MWQVILADLSLILFLTTLAGFSQLRQREQSRDLSSPEFLLPQGSAAAPLQSIYRATPQAMPFMKWLELENADPRAQLTIRAQYPPGGEQSAWHVALEMARDAGAAGFAPRVILDPGQEQALSASFAFDAVAGRRLPNVRR